MSDDQITVPDDGDERSDQDTSETTPESTADDASTVPPTCPNCGAPLEPDQAYCLECGEPTPAAVPLRKRRTGGPVIVAALLALAIGVGAIVWATTKEDSSAQVVTDTTTTGVLTDIPPFTDTTVTTDTTPTDQFPPFTDTTLTDEFPPFTDTTPTDDFPPFTDTTDTDEFPPLTDTTITEEDPPPFTDTTTTDEDPPPLTDPIDPAGDDQWTGGDAYTVIVSSETDRALADAFAERVTANGETAGVIVTDNYSSLTPGLFAVFVGEYATAAEARSAAQRLAGTYPGAYAAHVAA